MAPRAKKYYVPSKKYKDHTRKELEAMTSKKLKELASTIQVPNRSKMTKKSALISGIMKQEARLMDYGEYTTELKNDMKQMYIAQKKLEKAFRLLSDAQDELKSKNYGSTIAVETMNKYHHELAPVTSKVFKMSVGMKDDMKGLKRKYDIKSPKKQK